MYYDAHIHLLPGMDNGPCLETAVEMFRILKQEKCRMAIATPHFYADRETCTHFLRRRRESFLMLRNALGAEYKRFRLLVSAEVYLTPGLSSLPQLPKLCIPGTCYLPLELPLGKFEDWMMREISAILHKRQLHILICHLERYHFLYSPTDYKRLCGLPNTVYEVDANALMHTEISQDIIRMCLANKIVLLGSNAHNSLDRPPITETLVNKITNICGDTAYRITADQTERFFRLLF
jgi:protein-tyrosine phosphatase